REYTVVPGIDRCVIETWTDFRSLAVTQEVHHVSLAPEVAFEDTPAQVLVHEIEQFDRARMHRDGARLTARSWHAFNTPILDAAARQLHRQHASDCAAADDQHGYFSCVRHSSGSLH